MASVKGEVQPLVTDSFSAGFVWRHAQQAGDECHRSLKLLCPGIAHIAGSNDHFLCGYFWNFIGFHWNCLSHVLSLLDSPDTCVLPHDTCTWHVRLLFRAVHDRRTTQAEQWMRLTTTTSLAAYTLSCSATSCQIPRTITGGCLLLHPTCKHPISHAPRSPDGTATPADWRPREWNDCAGWGTS